MSEKRMFQVLIEWDGEQPPSTWYSRMHKLAGKVRGDKDESPVQRRDDKGLIFQEGAILCPSEWLARSLATYAKYEFGARSVALAEVTIKQDFQASKEDWEILERLQTHLSKRGPKPDAQQWTVTCLEEMRAYGAEEVHPLQCPHCNSTRILARKGAEREYQDDGADIVELWVRTRFAGSHFEPVDVNEFHDTAAPVYADTEVLGDKDALMVAMIESAGGLHEQLERMTRQDALAVLDGIFCARRYNEAGTRKDARVLAAARFFEMGGLPTQASLMETPTPDILDAASMVGARRTAEVLLSVYADTEPDNYV